MKSLRITLLILTYSLSATSVLAKEQTAKIDYNVSLMKAINSGNSAKVKKLIAEGANINYKNEHKETPLILAVKSARPLAEFYGQAQARLKSRWQARKKIIQVLLDAGANINHVNKWGNTALIEAIKNYDLNTVQDLLKLPAITKGSFFGLGQKPINHANKDGNTALIIAIKKIQSSYIVGNSHSYHTAMNSQKIVDALFNTPGIDLYQVNNKDESAIDLFNELQKQNKNLPGF